MAGAEPVLSPSPSGPGPDGRALCAVQGLAPEELTHHLTRALSGRGPALLPVPDGTPAPRVEALLAAMRPASLLTPAGARALDGAVPVRHDTALVVTTSGSTGNPKGVELSATALRASARASVARIGAVPGDAWLCVLPSGHISGLQVIMRALVTGTVATHAPFSVDTVSALAQELRPHVSLVPVQLRRLLAAGTDLSAFGTILLGGAAAEPALLERARRAGGRVITTYGMSETCGGCVYDGAPLAGVRIQVDSEGPAQPGRIWLSGPSLLSGYRLAPGEAGERDALVDDGAGRRWLRTNDLGRLDGGRLSVLGRVDEVINTGGHKVVPSQVNTLLQQHPQVAESVVVGRPDPEWGERVCAVVVPADPSTPPSLARVRSWIGERLPAYAAPHELEVRRTLPMLESGKPDLVALRTVPKE